MSIRNGVKAGWLILSADQILEDYALVIEDGIVVDIVPNRCVAGDSRYVDARDAIVCPGFINAHNHMYNIITRGMESKALDSSLSLKPMLEQWWWPEIEDKVTHEQIELTARYSSYELLMNGITCVNDILEAPYTVPGCLDIERDVLHQAGLRAILSLESSERISADNGRKCLNENRKFILEQRARRDNRIKGMMCIHTTFSCSKEFILSAREMARNINSMIQMHCSEGSDESTYCLADYEMLPMEYYDSLGFLDENVLAGQCVVLDERERMLIAKNNVKISHQPISNCVYGCGIAPIPELIDLGVNIGLGTDGDRDDFFEVMRMCYMLHKGHTTNSSTMQSDVVFRMATEMNAKAIGYEGIGSLQRGMCADYLVVKKDFPTPITRYNALDQFVLGCSNHDIKAVYIEGECVYRDGATLNFDHKKAQKDIFEFTKDLWRK